MKLNFVSKSEEYSKEMFKQLDSLGKELSDKQLIEMLNDPWRLSKVGAWMIGIGNRQTLLKNLIEYLEITPADYPEHALVNLLILTENESVDYIKDFLERQIKHYVSSKKNIEIGILSVHWAIAIIKYIDEEFNKSNFMELESKEYWINFINKVERKRERDTIIELLETKYYYNTIKETIRRIKTDDNMA